MKSFITDLGKEGFAIQLVSLGGLHSTGLMSCEPNFYPDRQSILVTFTDFDSISDRMAKTYMSDGMLAYVNNVQKPEKEEGVDLLRHQKWSGAEWMDKVLTGKKPHEPLAKKIANTSIWEL
jgi:isocitrate lyase